MNSSEKDCRATAEISKENGFFSVFRGSRALGRSPTGVGGESPSNAPGIGGQRIHRSAGATRAPLAVGPEAPTAAAKTITLLPAARHRPRFSARIRPASRGCAPLLPRSPVAWVPEPVPVAAAARPRHCRKGRRAAGKATRDRRARLGSRAPSDRCSPAAPTRLGLRDLGLCREAHGVDTPAGDEPGTARLRPIPDRLSGRNEVRPVSARIRPTRAAAGNRASARRRRAARRCGRRRHDGR